MRKQCKCVLSVTTPTPKVELTSKDFGVLLWLRLGAGVALIAAPKIIMNDYGCAMDTAT